MTTLTGILIILYCIFQLLYIDKFITKFNSDIMDGIIDAFMFVGITVWLVIHFFMQSAFINLIPFIPMIFSVNGKSKRIEKLMYIIILECIIVTVSFVLLNKMYFNLNFWTFNFN